MEIPVWVLIPTLMIFQLIFFLAFENYTFQQWINGSGAVCLVVAGIYISEGIYKKIKKREW